jgi:hypothetical protein
MLLNNNIMLFLFMNLCLGGIDSHNIQNQKSDVHYSQAVAFLRSCRNLAACNLSPPKAAPHRQHSFSRLMLLSLLLRFLLYQLKLFIKIFLLYFDSHTFSEVEVFA